ncbi:unnamed protein product [Trifolium pratense]|uniref:Uncharacterized protein n=1 Tax=Trifolium pratense TaxID=57577 RepID=A0ACB0LQW7_TRIPR|nr:unnamed protein product [Trifolium pratense]
MKLDGKFEDVAGLLPGKEIGAIKVRVLCLWKVPVFMNPMKFNSLEMVLCDEKGEKYMLLLESNLLICLIRSLKRAECMRSPLCLFFPRVVCIQRLFIDTSLVFKVRQWSSLLRVLIYRNMVLASQTLLKFVHLLMIMSFWLVSGGGGRIASYYFPPKKLRVI